ncbi:uncharacterized protein [Phyllobates terribilis]|uniref:uncharacterized protein n=1 Tax=Phyllobates terribilis TaxID=111132 RepID=UPI003CCB6FDA
MRKNKVKSIISRILTENLTEIGQGCDFANGIQIRGVTNKGISTIKKVNKPFLFFKNLYYYTYPQRKAVNGKILRMDNNGSHSSAPASSSGSGSGSGQFLRQLNKSSHKISKPISSLRKPFDPPPLPPPPESTENPNPNPNQPPVYNISKADFRDLVQKLTGSPAHDRISTPPPPSPPVHPTPKPPTSRLHRIRPPPLAQIANRPPPLLVAGFPGTNTFSARPLSPLPPLPSCHAAAESPISAYMRFLHTSVDSSDPRRNQTVLQPLNSPKNHNPTATPQNQRPMSQNQPPPPSSPLPFGCFPSPKSPCPLLSSNVLFSPTGMGQLGFSQLPLSPNVPPVPSPRWKNSFILDDGEEGEVIPYRASNITDGSSNSIAETECVNAYLRISRGELDGMSKILAFLHRITPYLAEIARNHPLYRIERTTFSIVVLGENNHAYSKLLKL